MSVNDRRKLCMSVQQCKTARDAERAVGALLPLQNAREAAISLAAFGRAGPGMAERAFLLWEEVRRDRRIDT